jgi:spore coat protein U-like protein
MQMNLNFSARLVRLVSTALPLAVCLLADVGAHAVGANLNVSASISPSCVISTSALAFGAYDAVAANAASPRNGSGSVHVTCTKDAEASVALDVGENDASGARRMTDDGTNFLAYSLWQDSTRSDTPWGSGDDAKAIQGTGSNQDITVYGKIASGQNGVPAGDYSDVVIATVTF